MEHPMKLSVGHPVGHAMGRVVVLSPIRPSYSRCWVLFWDFPWYMPWDSLYHRAYPAYVVNKYMALLGTPLTAPALFFMTGLERCWSGYEYSVSLMYLPLKISLVASDVPVSYLSFFS